MTQPARIPDPGLTVSTVALKTTGWPNGTELLPSVRRGEGGRRRGLTDGHGLGIARFQITGRVGEFRLEVVVAYVEGRQVESHVAADVRGKSFGENRAGSSRRRAGVDQVHLGVQRRRGIGHAVNNDRACRLGLPVYPGGSRRASQGNAEQAAIFQRLDFQAAAQCDCHSTSVCLTGVCGQDLPCVKRTWQIPLLTIAQETD